MVMNDFETAAILTVAATISIVHYLSHKISYFLEKHHYRLLSFNGGLFIALILLILLPEVVEASDSPYVYLLILFGFVIFHLSGKFLYQHVKNKKEMLGELKTLHEVGFFIDHLMLGFVLVTSTEFSPHGYLIVIPIFLHTVSSSMSLQHIHERAKTGLNKVVLSLSPFIGALIAILVEVEKGIRTGTLALILGMLFYIGVRDFVPREEKGYPLLFLGGIVIVVLIWVLIGH